MNKREARARTLRWLASVIEGHAQAKPDGLYEALDDSEQGVAWGEELLHEVGDALYERSRRLLRTKGRQG